MSDVLNSALLDLWGGLSVISIQPREKRPLIQWEQYQSERSTENEIKECKG